MVSRLRRGAASTTTTDTVDPLLLRKPEQPDKERGLSPRRHLFFFKRRMPDYETRDSTMASTAIMTETMQQTRVVPIQQIISQQHMPAMTTTTTTGHRNESCEESTQYDDWSVPLTSTALCPPASSPSALFFQFCGTKVVPADDDDETPANTTTTVHRVHPEMPDDPTVEESIECVIAASQGELADLFQQYHDHRDDQVLRHCHIAPPTPSGLQQSLLKNRSFQRLPPRFTAETKLRLPQSPDRHRRVPYSSVGPPQQPLVSTSSTTNSLPPKLDPMVMVEQCDCAKTNIPQALPQYWPQRPLLMRPTPNSGTIVKGVRFVNDTDYLWTPNQNGCTSTTRYHRSWVDALHTLWDDDEVLQDDDYMCGTTTAPSLPGCSQCVCLPINSGDEPPGRTLVTDFESNLFCGTLLLRIRNSQGTTNDKERLEKGYFHGLNRRYQVVIRGKFKTAIPWTECLTGFQLERPAGKLPPKWIVNGALNVIKFFAPQVQTNMHGDRPYSLTPLGSAPQVLAVDQPGSMEPIQEEPKDHQCTLLGQASTAKPSLQRARQRKKNFDKIFAAAGDKTTATTSQPWLMTDPHKEYTFEFLQHLFNFDDFTIELGSMIGSVSLQTILAGQALQIMASHGPPNKLDDPTSIRNRLWSFDIWHEMLLSTESPKQ